MAAVNLDIFHAHCDRVQMTNIAQMINVLQSMILTDKEKMVLTPTYYVFQMYKVHQGATFIPIGAGCACIQNSRYKHSKFACDGVA